MKSIFDTDRMVIIVELSECAAAMLETGQTSDIPMQYYVTNLISYPTLEHYY